MAWRRIAPRYLRHEDATGLTLGYTSDGGRDIGHLLLLLDSQRKVARFELVDERFLSGCELFAEWDRTTGFRIGEVEADDAGDWDQRLKMSPIVRYRRPTSTMVGRLLGHVQRNAGLLDSYHRQTVISVLREELQSSVAEASDTTRGVDTA